MVYYNSRKRLSHENETTSSQEELEAAKEHEEPEENAFNAKGEGESRGPASGWGDNLQKTGSRSYLTPISYEPHQGRDARPGQKSVAGQERSKVDSGVRPSDSIQSSAHAQPQQQRPSRIIPKPYLEKSKKELRTLLLEKELVSAALTRLYEAEAQGEITREERETLGVKYRDELKSLDERILKVDAFIEVGDLETLRDQLVRLVTQKIDSIEKRIESTRRLAEPLIEEIMKRDGGSGGAPKSTIAPPLPRQIFSPPKPRVPDISDLLTSEEEGASQSAGGRSGAPPGIVDPQLESQQRVIAGVSEQKGVEGMPSGETPSGTMSPTDQQQENTGPTNEGASFTSGPSSSSSLEAIERQKRKIAEKRQQQQQDSQAEQLQQELLEALDRLEKLDVES